MKEPAKQTTLPEFVFRGTTLGYAGGAACNSEPYRCFTTRNPVKALYFSSVCRTMQTSEPVIYIAKTNELLQRHVVYIESDDLLARAEEEIIWVMLPADFIKLSEGYITFQEMRTALNGVGVPIGLLPKKHTELSSACFATEEMDIKQIRKLMDIIKPMIKYP